MPAHAMPPVTHAFAEPPATGQTIEVAPGIHWLRMPLPFALDHINLWLLEDGDGVSMIDTGYTMPAVQAAWEQIFKTFLRGRKITRIFVTHFHPDHSGLAWWHYERWGVLPWMTGSEWLSCATALRSTESNNLEFRLKFLANHGIETAMLDRMRGEFSHFAHGVPHLPPAFRRISDNDEITINGRRWIVRVGRGHAPEHACLHCPELGVLISGDQILPKITPNVSVWYSEPFGEPLGHFLASIETFRSVPPDTLVLPAHKLPFRGLHTRLDELARHHAARLDEAFAACESKPHTAFEILKVLFRRELDSHQTGFALGESLAHLHYLVAKGRLARIVDDSGAVRFARA